MVRLSIILILLSGTILQLKAQESAQLTIDVWYNARVISAENGFSTGSNGSGLSLGMEKDLGSSYDLSISGEIGAAGVGNYLAITAGVFREFNFGTLTSFSAGLNLINGAGLFRPSPIYLYGFELKNTLDFLLKEDSGPGVILAARFYSYPNYAQYSEVNSFVDLRLGLRYIF